MSQHHRIYWIVGGLLAVLLVVMLVTYDYNSPDAEAKAKANQLIANFEQAGLPTPADADQVAQALGTDGGVVCQLAGSSTAQGILKTQLGVGGEFYFRPVILDRRTLEGVVLIAQVYCPDKLADAQKFVDDLKYRSVIRS